MNPELKAYLDEWAAENKRIHREIHDALDRTVTAFGAAGHDNSTPAIDTADDVLGPVQASSDTTELVTTSVGLAEPLATVSIGEESLVVARAVPSDTGTVAPAFCSTECAAQAITASTTTALLPWVSMSLASPATYTTNGVVSTELASDNNAGEHGALFDDITVEDILVLAAVAAGKGTLDCEPVKGAGSTAPTQTTEWSLAFTPSVPITMPSATAATTAPLMLWSYYLTSVTPSIKCHGLLLRPTPWPSFLGGQFNAPENRPRPWPSFTSSCGGRRQKQSGLPPQARYPALVQQSSDWRAMTSATQPCSTNYEVMLLFSHEPVSIGNYRACSILQWLLHGNAPSLLVNEFSEVDTLASLFKLSSSMFSYATSSGCLLWMVWYSVNEPYNPEGSFEHYDTAMADSPDAVFMSMRSTSYPSISMSNAVHVGSGPSVLFHAGSSCSDGLWQAM